MMRKYMSRLVALFLVLSMVVLFVPVQAQAADITRPAGYTDEEWEEYLRMLRLQAEQAELAAKALVGHYVATTIVDTILCLDGTAVLGTCIAEELTKSGFRTINQHQTIYVVEPEYNANSQIIFRDNIQPMIRGKHVLVLMASVTTGFTANRSIEAIKYYGGIVAGVAAIYRHVDSVGGYPVRSLYSTDDLPDYQSYDYHDCPYCKAGQKVDALVNSFGISAL